MFPNLERFFHFHAHHELMPDTMQSGVFTCFYADNTRVDFDIHHEGHFFDIDSQPLVDIHLQPDLVKMKGAWEVVHDKLYIISGEGELITIDAVAVDENIDPKMFFDGMMKTYREEEGLKYPECWEYISFKEDEEDGNFANENLEEYFAPIPPPTP